MSPSCSCFSFATSSATSPFSTVVLFHSGLSSVEETTYFGMLLNLSANSPSLRRPRSGKAFVGHPSQQQRVGRERFVELELVALLAAAELEGSSRRA